MTPTFLSNPIQLDYEEEDLIDQFASKAIQGILANSERWKQIADDYKTGKKTYDECSESNAVKAYSVAFEMLKLRRKIMETQDDSDVPF